MAETHVWVWPAGSAPTEEAILAIFNADHLMPYRWSNAAYDRYAPHQHDYDKVIVVVRGSITFCLPQEGRQLVLQLGDRLDLPAGITHDALVGPEGVVCLEAHRT